MIFLTETQDFITIVSETEAWFNPMWYIVLGVFIVACIIVLCFSVKYDWALPGILSILGALVSGVFIIVNIVYSMIPVTTEKYNVPAFQAWASETYLVDLNDAQAESLLENASTSDKASDSYTVRVESFNGSDALVALCHDNDEYSLFVTENIAPPSR